DAVREYETCRTVFAAELGCDPGPRLRSVFRRLLAATSEQDDRLRDLVAAVVRLHHVLDTSTPPHRPQPDRGEGGGQRSAAAEPGALQEDC
ncbi:BTAD domain-containing putative transcriptional regulator, partial [Variovorax sp. 2RAF20]